MNVQPNTEARSCNYCCSGKAMSIASFDCISVPLGTVHTACNSQAPCYSICGLSISTIVFHIISKMG
jgi:hypothetical protein